MREPSVCSEGPRPTVTSVTQETAVDMPWLVTLQSALAHGPVLTQQNIMLALSTVNPTRAAVVSDYTTALLRMARQ